MRILSVRLSVTCINCDKMVERSVHIYIPYERTFSLVFWEEEWLVGGDPFYVKFWSTGPSWSKIADFEPLIAEILDQSNCIRAKATIFDLFARSDSAVTPSEKSSININRKSSTHFPMSPRWPSYVVPKPPKGGSKTQSVRNLNNKLP